VRTRPYLLLSTPVREVDLTQIADLLRTDPRQGRWRSPGEIAEHVGSASWVVRAIDPADNRLVGVGWVLADGLGSGYLADVFVAEDRRTEGVGSEIVRRLGSAPGIGRPTWLVGHDSATAGVRPVAARAAGRPQAVPGALV
jgi:hypothetical protein